MKKLLRDAWRAITGKKHDRAQRFPKNGFGLASHADAALAEADVAFGDAVNAQQAGRLPEAQAAYRRILERIPTYAPALHFLGVTYGQAGDFAEAERLIRQSIQIQETAECFENLALALGQQGKRDEAIAAYRDALKLAPDNVLTYRNLGDHFLAQARYADAEQAYRGALALRTDDADTHFKLGMVLAELKHITDAIDAYRKALLLRPAYPDAYNNLGNLLKGMHRYEDAEDAYRQALLLQPDAAAVHCNLGQLMQETGRRAEAEAAYQRALALQPESARIHNILGIFYAATGRRTEADAAYRRAIFFQPDYADAHNNLGNLLKETDHRSDAEAAYRQALTLNPGHAEAWGNLGVLLEDAGQFEDAETALRKALALKPDSAIAHNNLGNLFCKIKRKTEAEVVFRKALELDPNYAEACGNLAVLLQGSGQIAEAEALHRKTIVLKPDSVAAICNFGTFLSEALRYAEAEEIYHRALALQPEFADAHFGLGNVLKETGRYTDAEAAYRYAITLKPNLAGAHNNLGFLLQGSQRFAEAEAAYRQALLLDAEFELAHYNLALLCLSQKRFEEGWENYERRWSIKYFNWLPRQFPQRTWQGEALADETLLVWQEQGVGDIVLYAGMIPDLLALGVRLIVECEPRLAPLLTRSFPNARVVVRRDPAHISTREARWQSPLGSLGRWLRTRQDDFTWHGRYLIPDAAEVSAFRQRYHALGAGPGPVVGISWRSSNEKVGHIKSVSLAEWAPLLALPGVTFVNLQYGDCEGELSQLKRDTGITVHHDSTVNSLKNLDGFAAQVAAMDLVISTSNSTVHFAGALGVPVWTLLPKGGGGLLWYWCNEGEDSLWYPSMRLFRQQRLGEWPSMIARVSGELREFLMKFR